MDLEDDMFEMLWKFAQKAAAQYAEQNDIPYTHDLALGMALGVTNDDTSMHPRFLKAYKKAIAE